MATESPSRQHLLHLVEIRPEQEILASNGWVDLKKLDVVARTTKALTYEQILDGILGGGDVGETVVERINKANMTSEGPDPKPGKAGDSPMVMGQIKPKVVEHLQWVLVGTVGPKFLSGCMVMLVNGCEPLRRGHTYPAGTALVWVHCRWISEDCEYTDLPYDKAFYSRSRQQIAIWTVEAIEGSGTMHVVKKRPDPRTATNKIP